MKKLAIVLGIILGFLAVFWLGLMSAFPGAAASRFLESQLNRYPGFSLSLAPAHLRWNRLVVGQAVLRGEVLEKPRTLLTLHNLTVPITWTLIQGLGVQAAIGKSGTIRVFWPWDKTGLASLETSLRLEELPVLAALKPISLQGQFMINAEIAPPESMATAKARLPTGQIEIKGNSITVRNLSVLGRTLPPSRFSAINAEIRTGQTLELKSFVFEGDATGRITGSLTPNLRNPRASKLSANLQTAFKDSWLAELGPFRPMAESYLKNGQLRARVDGTAGRPVLRPLGVSSR